MSSVFPSATVGAATMALAAGLSPPAQAAYTVALVQVADPSQPLGSNVVATGSGTIDLAGLSLNSSGGQLTAGMGPSAAAIGVASGPVDQYLAVNSGPLSFGTGVSTIASSSSGSAVGLTAGSAQDLITGKFEVFVPQGYTGSPLSDTSTYHNATFASLGVTPGSYVWTWGTGADADSFTLNIRAAKAVPEPTSLALFGVGLAALGMVLRTRRG